MSTDVQQEARRAIFQSILTWAQNPGSVDNLVKVANAYAAIVAAERGSGSR